MLPLRPPISFAHVAERGTPPNPMGNIPWVVPPSSHEGLEDFGPQAAVPDQGSTLKVHRHLTAPTWCSSIPQRCAPPLQRRAITPRCPAPRRASPSMPKMQTPAALQSQQSVTAVSPMRQRSSASPQPPLERTFACIQVVDASGSLGGFVSATPRVQASGWSSPRPATSPRLFRAASPCHTRSAVVLPCTAQPLPSNANLTRVQGVVHSMSHQHSVQALPEQATTAGTSCSPGSEQPKPLEVSRCRSSAASGRAASPPTKGESYPSSMRVPLEASLSASRHLSMSESQLSTVAATSCCEAEQLSTSCTMTPQELRATAQTRPEISPLPLGCLSTSLKDRPTARNREDSALANEKLSTRLAMRSRMLALSPRRGKEEADSVAQHLERLRSKVDEISEQSRKIKAMGDRNRGLP